MSNSQSEQSGFTSLAVALAVGQTSKELGLAQFSTPTTLASQRNQILLNELVLRHPQAAASLWRYDIETTLCTWLELNATVCPLSNADSVKLCIAASTITNLHCHLPKGCRSKFFNDYAGVATIVRQILTGAEVWADSDTEVWNLVADWRRTGLLALLPKKLAAHHAAAVFTQASCQTGCPTEQQPLL